MSTSRNYAADSPAASSDRIFARIVNEYDPRKPLSDGQIRLLKRIPHLIDAAFRLAENGSEEETNKAEIILAQLGLISVDDQSQTDAPHSDDMEIDANERQNDDAQADQEMNDNEQPFAYTYQAAPGGPVPYIPAQYEYRPCWGPHVSDFYPAQPTESQPINAANNNGHSQVNGIIQKDDETITINLGTFFSGLPPSVLEREAWRRHRDEERRRQHAGFDGWHGQNERPRRTNTDYRPQHRRESSRNGRMYPGQSSRMGSFGF